MVQLKIGFCIFVSIIQGLGMNHVAGCMDSLLVYF